MCYYSKGYQNHDGSLNQLVGRDIFRKTMNGKKNEGVRINVYIATFRRIAVPRSIVEVTLLRIGKRVLLLNAGARAGVEQ